jgi:hypothetical protein
MSTSLLLTAAGTRLDASRQHISITSITSSITNALILSRLAAESAHISLHSSLAATCLPQAAILHAHLIPRAKTREKPSLTRSSLYRSLHTRQITAAMSRFTPTVPGSVAGFEHLELRTRIPFSRRTVVHYYPG